MFDCLYKELNNHLKKIENNHAVYFSWCDKHFIIGEWKDILLQLKQKVVKLHNALGGDDDWVK